MDSKTLAKTIAQQAFEMKGEDICVLDLQGLSGISDFFVICTGTSDRQLKAIGDRVIQELKKEGISPLSNEGYEHGSWVLVDYPGVVFHLFNEQARAYYNLEDLWKKAPRLRLRFPKKPIKKAACAKPRSRLQK